MKNQYIALLSLGSVALGVTAWAGARQNSATSTSTASTVAPALVSAAAPAKVDADGFRPSAFAGVSVRDRPSGAGGKRVGSRGWVALRPGGKLPTGGIGRFSNAPLRKSKGTTARGGDKLSGSALMHADVAVRGADGSVAMGDVPASVGKKLVGGQRSSR